MATLNLYILIKELATADEIRDLLRRHKEDHPKEILVSGTKDDVVNHLERAVAEGIVKRTEVLDLLQEAEENGDQHIFYFVPKSAAVARRCKNGQEVASLLWGDEWKEKMGFPRFTLVPSSHEWADFRVGLRRKPNDWIAKIYGHEVQRRLFKEETLVDDTLVRYYKKVEQRTVSLARWNEGNGPSLLEIRVPRCDSKATLLFRREAICTRLNPALTEDDCLPWCLRKAIRRR